MSMYHVIPELLDALVATPDIKEAAGKVGIDERTVHRWTVQSRNGKAELQEVEFCGVVAPFHIHRENARRLVAEAMEQAFLDRCRNGYYVGSYYKGEPVWQEDEKIVAYFGAREFNVDECEVQFGQSDKFLRVDGKRVQVMQHMKPSEQAVQAALQHWRNYAAHVKHDVKVGGVVRVDGDQQPKQIEQKKPEEVFEDAMTEDGEAENSDLLAIQREASDQDEMAKLQQAGVFAPQSIEFVSEGGAVTVIEQDITPPKPEPAACRSPVDDPVEMTTAAATPEIADPVQAAKTPMRADLEARLAALLAKGPSNPRPTAQVVIGRPSDEAAPKFERADQAITGRNAAPLPGGYKR